MKPTEMDHDDQLRREADLTRKRLLDTVDELDERKHKVESMRLLVPAAGGTLVGIYVLMKVVDGSRRWARRRHRRRAWRRFMKALHLR
jgi:hypothetical protein